MKRLAVIAIPLCLAGVVSAQFVPSTAPVKDGVRATADLPNTQHKRNVGGSDGAGLCVYTSAWHAAIWQDEKTLFDFRKWMERRPGGSYPEKFDATLKAYCAEKGMPLPGYVQHTGGDEEFLRLALRTGRMPCVTYCGVDGSASYGGEVIAHMVNVVHLDEARACVLDNNFPGRWLWMSAAEFLERWRGVRADGRPYYIGRNAVGGGWAIVLLASPPSPYPAQPAVMFGGSACICGDNCECEKNGKKCPGQCPVIVGQCRNGVCPVLVPQQQPEPIGNPPSEAHEWGRFPDGQWGWRFKVAKPVPQATPAVGADPFPGGVDISKIAPNPCYWVNGQKCSQIEAIAALARGLTDDSGRWNLAAVGDSAFLAKVRADLDKVPGEVREKLHVQTYAPDGWQVAQFRLAPGVTLRKPAVGRIGADVGAVPVADYSAVRLAALLGSSGGPAPAPTPPTDPKPNPKPDDPKPTPDPAPAPQPAPGGNGLLAILAALAALWFLFRKRA